MRRLLTNGPGFTLIELLVVIAVIAILAAILFPVFAQVREKARQATCLSNHKQIVLAALIYVDDYDGRFPGGRDAYGLWYPGPEGSWEKMPTRCCGDVARISVAALLRAYLKSTDILHCPDDPNGDRDMWDGGWDPRVTRVSYAWPYGVSQGAGWPNYPSGRGGRVTGVPILLAEVSHPALLPINNDAVASRHSREARGEARWIVAFADGHVKFARWVDPWLPVKQRPWEWSLNNPRQPLDIETPCQPTCAEEAARN
jgi:prepilin-type N-terminal cleavage/methylation domain-containing protein